MWRTLSDESRQAIRDLCDKHGARLYDYCRTELAAGDAEQAVAGALLTAHLYADRVTDLGLRRPWLYGLARAHRAIVAKPASIGSWSRPGRMSELLPEALLSLDRPQRELLDLSVRHGLSDAELAVIFELDAARVGAVVAQAAAGLEGWFAAIMAARGRDGCPDLTARMAEWVAAPGRRARARIGRHIQSCSTCRAAPRTMTAGALLRRLPITTVPGTLPSRLASAQPLPGEGPVWRVDGFPAQARLLVEPGPADTGPMAAGPADTGPLDAGPARTGPAAVPPAAEATPHVPIADPTTANPGEPWSAAGAAAADQEHLAARPVRGRHPFTPPSRTRAFRGGAHGDKLVYSAALKGESNGFHKPSGEIIRYGGITLSGELDELQGRQWQEYWRDRANDDDPEAGAPVRAVVRLALIFGVGLLAAGLVWAMLNAREHPATITKAASQTSVLLEEPRAPSRWVAEVTTAAKAGLTSVPRKADLPRPAPPAARLSPASVWLGSQRTGSFALSCTGRCAITSAVGTDGIAVSGTRFRVREPVTRPGCGERATVRRGNVVQWAGETTGDGTRTGGTTTAKGTLALSVTWTVAQDKGVRLLDADGVRWSNCR